MTKIKIERLTIEGLSEIEVTYFKGFSRIQDYLNILVIKYSGKYGIGSAGNRDAQFMFAKGEYGLKLFEPSGAILDFRKLEYEWGDMLDLVFNVGSNQYIDSEFPIALVVGDKCEEAIGTLIHGIYSKESATTKEFIFDNFEEAWKYVEEKMDKTSNTVF